MAKSISPDWIEKYLIDVAETHGCDFLSTPVCTQPKKVQVIKARYSTYHFRNTLSLLLRYSSSVTVVPDSSDTWRDQLDMGNPLGYNERGFRKVYQGGD